MGRASWTHIRQNVPGLASATQGQSKSGCVSKLSLDFDKSVSLLGL